MTKYMCVRCAIAVQLLSAFRVRGGAVNDVHGESQDCQADAPQRRGISHVQISNVGPSLASLTPAASCECAADFEAAAAAAEEQRGVLPAELVEDAQAGGSDQCEPFCDDTECPCLKPWSERCLIKSCSECAPCTNETAPTPVWGMWTITRQHKNEFRTKTKENQFCGKSSDEFKIECREVKYCREDQNSTGQFVVDATGAEVTDGWFCCNQAMTQIVSPSFAPNASCDAETAPTPIWGMWTITRQHKNEFRTKTKENQFCGKSSDEFKIECREHKYCRETQNSTGQVVVDATGAEVTNGWFCCNQAMAQIGSPSFAPNASCEVA